MAVNIVRQQSAVQTAEPPVSEPSGSEVGMVSENRKRNKSPVTVQILRTDRRYYASICSDSMAALKALRAIRTVPPLVHQCQRALNDISARHAVSLFWVPGHAGVRGNEIADGPREGRL